MKRRIFYAFHAAFFLAVGAHIFFFGQGLVRGFFGDVLAVIFLYFFLQTIVATRPYRIAFFVVCCALAIEYAQYAGIIFWNGFWREIFLGNTFDPWDLVAYFGAIVVVMVYDIRLKDYFLCKAFHLSL